jgi:hypothetical protein
MIKLCKIWLLAFCASAVLVVGVAVGVWAAKKMSQPPPKRIPDYAQSPVDEDLERERRGLPLTVNRPAAQFWREAGSVDRWCVFASETLSDRLTDYTYCGECGPEGVNVTADRDNMFFVFRPSVNVEMP